MDRSDTDRDPQKTGPQDETVGNASAVELSKVKDTLSLKIEMSDAHYSTIVPLGKGSFGEVHNAHDTLLGRDVAIKSLKPQYRDQDEVIDRFLKEARGTAQLEHPNIMPVHEIGINKELGIYFTMKKIQGETLKEVLDYLKSGTSLYQKKYPLTVLLEIFLSVCNGVAFAHSKGVIHRDLKPANIMIGEYGEVLILDWGLVKQMDDEQQAAPGQVQLRMDEIQEGMNTIDGAVSGTPNYMAPEQAEGNLDSVDFQSDIYSLGAILYHILAHVPPFEKMQLGELLKNVKSGTFESPRRRRPDLKIPHELNAICLKAMAKHQVSRYRSVEALARDVRNYIANFEVTAYAAPRHVRFWRLCKRNPVKASVITAVVTVLLLVFTVQRAILYGSYQANLSNAESLQQQAMKHVEAAKHRYDVLDELLDSARSKLPSAEESESEAVLRNHLAQVDKLYNLAVGYYESVPLQLRYKPTIRKGISDILLNRINLALYLEDYDLATQWMDAAYERVSRWRAADTVALREKLNRIEERLMGYGSLTLHTPEVVEEVMIFSVDEHDPRFTQGDMVDRSFQFPMVTDPIANDSYILEVVISGRRKIPYPLYVDHGEQKEITLQIPYEVPDGMAFVPGGPFFYGGEASRFYRKHRFELPPYFIRAYEVTFAEYLMFWKQLEDPELREAYRSRIQYTEKERRFYNAWDDEGQLLNERLRPELPLVGITRAAAEAYCEWLSVQKGAVIRLPTAEEWEKAARGVDGRRYVWGNGLDERLTFTKKNLKAKEEYPLFAPPGSFSLTDVSPYNVFDMAGNVREMTSTLTPGSDSLYQIKGGSAVTPATFLPCSYASDTPVAPSDVGFRYVQEVDPETDLYGNGP